MSIFYWLSLYWLPLIGMFLGAIAFAHVVRLRGWNREFLQREEGRLALLGLMAIMIGLFYIFPVEEIYPRGWLFEKTGLSLPDSAQNIRFYDDAGGFFGDGDQILYATIGAQEIQELLKNGMGRSGFSKWVKGPIGDGEELPALPFGADTATAPRITNSDSVMYSKRLYGPPGSESANYIEVFLVPHTGEILVHVSDS